MADGSGGRPSKQVKIVGSAKSQMNVPYFNQQQGAPPTAATERHPNSVQYITEQSQQLQDKGGA